MTKVIAIANQKGGVGKTSTTVNLGAGLVRQGYAVLAIDFDPQTNLTMALGFKSPDDMEYTVSNVLAKAMDEEPIDPAEGILTTEEGVDLMPSSIQLSRYELSLVNEMNRESMLRQFVDAAKLNYTQKGDLFYPDLTLPPQPSGDIGRFGRMRKKFLKEHQKDTFALLLMENRLTEHLMEIDRQALEMIDTITEQTAKATGVTEELKASDQLEWIRRMNELIAAAEQQVIREIVLS